jgi:hypothetical protein
VADFEIVAIPACNVTYEVLHELRVSLCEALTELSIEDHLQDVKRILDDLAAIERVHILTEEIIDPREAGE